MPCVSSFYHSSFLPPLSSLIHFTVIYFRAAALILRSYFSPILIPRAILISRCSCLYQGFIQISLLLRSQRIDFLPNKT